MNSHRRFPRLAALLACALLASATPAQQPKKKERLLPLGTFAGEISRLNKDSTSLTLRVPAAVAWGSVTPIPNGVRITRGVRRWTESLEVWLPEDVKVRLPVRPRFDDKGRPIRGEAAPAPTKDRRLGGVPGDPADLEVGQRVEVTLQRNRAGHLFATLIRVLP